MNKILIIGKNSYIGTHFFEFSLKFTDFSLQYVDSRNGIWEMIDFSPYDVICHAAGIAHVTTDPKMEAQYYAVNRDLPIAIAQKAKKEGVKQFILLSSMMVYADEKMIEHSQIITKTTVPTPSSLYGKSKLQAENAILALQGPSFIVSILRLPMVYGAGCKGNFPRLIALALHTPLFPDIENERSMIYIENLSEYLRLCILNRYSGLLFPQNSEYLRTKDIVSYTAKKAGHHLLLTKALNPLLRTLSPYFSTIYKVFGSKVYDKSLSPGLESYNIYSFEESMERYFSSYNYHGIAPGCRGKLK